MRVLRRRTTEDQDEDSPYWMSFTDLMAALLAVFILSVVVLALNLGVQQRALAEQQNQVEEQHDAFEAEIDALQSSEVLRNEMVEEISEELQEQGIEVHVSENGAVLSISSDELGFAPGEFEISSDNEDVAAAVGEAISQAIQQGDRSELLDTVFIEGHTDDQPMPGLEGTGNWGLSSFRAISLWNFWNDNLESELRPNRLQTTDGQPLFSVSGYGETRPVTEQQTNESEREANRRIDIRFTIVRPTATDLQDLNEDFEPEGSEGREP